MSARSTLIEDERAERNARNWNLAFIILAAIIAQTMIVGAAMHVAVYLDRKDIAAKEKAKAEAPRPAWSCKEAMRICADALKRDTKRPF